MLKHQHKNVYVKAEASLKRKAATVTLTPMEAAVKAAIKRLDATDTTSPQPATSQQQQQQAQLTPQNLDTSVQTTIEAQPLQCSDIDSLPPVESKTTTNKCVEDHPFPQNVHSLGDFVSQNFVDWGCWEQSIVASIVEHFGTRPRLDRTFIDIGANIGTFTTTLANLGHPIIAVEPFRLNVPLMLQTLCRPGAATADVVGDRIKVFKVALSDRSPGQKMCLWSTNHLRNNGNARLVPYFEGRKDFGLDRYKTCREVIHSYTLDELLGLDGNNSSPLLSRRPWGMKMDIEGYETLALRGASKLLLTSGMAPCRIWFEYQKEVTLESGAGATEIFDFLLQQAGYKRLFVADVEEWKPLSSSGPYPESGDFMGVHGDPECQTNGNGATD